MKGNIGLFFGTFNPIHVGHLVLAEYMLNYGELDRVLFVITPHNPLKQKSTLLPDRERLHLAYLALEDQLNMQPSDIEFGLPQPNYTAQTMAYFREKHPEANFTLIMGEDNLKSFHKWKNYEAILEYYELYVYPRISAQQVPAAFADHPRIHRVDAPVIEISATFIRKQHKAGKNIRPLLPEPVWNYLDEMNFYR